MVYDKVTNWMNLSEYHDLDWLSRAIMLQRLQAVLYTCIKLGLYNGK